MQMPNNEKTLTCDLEKRLSLSWPVREWCDTHVVLAISGGADSVALLRAMLALKCMHGGRGQLFVAHVNHGLRGQVAEEDATWLQALCKQFDLPLEIAKVDVGAFEAANGDGWEAAARMARYEALREIAEQRGARFIVTAHTVDDQIETVLHRILRGTGIEGLAGIARVRPLSPSVALVRPILNVTRYELLEYLAALGQEYRTDATNCDNRWTRNRLRNELLPVLRGRYNAGVDGALTRLALQAAEVQQVVAELAIDMAGECVVANSQMIRIDSDKLKKRPLAIVREVLKYAWRKQRWPEQSMGYNEWQLLAAMVFEESAQSTNFPGSIQARCTGQIVELLLLDSCHDNT